MSFPSGDISIWNSTLEKMRPIVKDAGYDLLTSDPQWDVQRQVSDWDAWIQRDVKAIMGYPARSADALIPVTQRAASAGIPVIGYAVKWDGVKHAALLDNHADGEKVGTALGEWINKNMPGESEVPVGMLSDRSTDLSIERMEGFTQALKGVAPNARVYELPALSREQGYSVTKSQLTAVPETKVWAAISADQALGGYQALLDSGVKKDDPSYVLTTFDGNDETLDIFKQPDSFFSIVYLIKSEELAAASAKLLLAAAKGEEVDDTVVSSVRVTRENVEDFYVGSGRR